MIAPTAIIRGVGITLGMDLVDVEGTTGYYDSNLDGKARKAAELLKYGLYDFGFVHVKATDDAGHDKDHLIKVEQLEKCDRMIGTFIEAVKYD
jgi:2,3-bisphosphoglycerate-independent phosphoglycerate mutase